MAQPTKTDLQTMDYAYGGVPFVQTAAKTGIDLDTLDYAYGGVPFWAVAAGGTPPPPTGITKQFMHYARLRSNQ